MSRIFRKTWATLEATFGGTMLLGAAIEWDKHYTVQNLALLLLAAQPVLATASHLLATQAPHIEGSRFWKLCVLVWLYTIPVGYVLAMLVMMLDSREFFLPISAFVLFAPFIVPLVTLCLVPAIGVTAWLVEQWTCR